jgi:hypothetical protein
VLETYKSTDLTLLSNRLQQEHRRSTRPPKNQARLPRTTSPNIRSRAAGAMVKHTAGHRVEDRPRSDALAISQLHGLLPSGRHLPLNAW